MPKRKAENPISKPLLVVGCCTLLFVGGGALLEWDAVLDVLAIPATLLCSTLVLVYCVFAFKLGEIASVDRMGRVHQHYRKKEPISFYFLLLLYGSLSAMTASYLIMRLLGVYTQ